MSEDVAIIEPSKLTGANKKKIKAEGERFRSGDSTSQRKTQRVYCTSFDSRIGRIYVASSEQGVCKISVPRETKKDFFGWLKDHFDLEMVSDNRARNKDVIDQLTRYFNGKLAKFTCPIDPIGTPFQLRV